MTEKHGRHVILSIYVYKATPMGNIPADMLIVWKWMFSTQFKTCKSQSYIPGKQWSR